MCPARPRTFLLVLLAALALVSACATFPDQGPREWREQIEDRGELGGPPELPESSTPAPPPEGRTDRDGTAEPPGGCVDPDPQVVATCLDPVGAIAVLPDGQSALVAERQTGRVLRVRRGSDPELVSTVAVDPAGGGGLTGLVLSPGFAEDQLIYAYASTAEDNRLVRIAPGEPPKPVLTGIPRGPVRNGGALGVGVDGFLLIATGDAGTGADVGADPTSLAGKLLRIDTLGRPAPDNPDPSSPVFASGLAAPGGVCTDPVAGTSWVTDATTSGDVLHRVGPGPLGPAEWTWPDRPGAAGCAAQLDSVAVALTSSAALFVLRPAEDGTFTGEPETVLAGIYGRLTATTPGPDGLLWLGTANTAGAPGSTPAPSDDRVIRIEPPAGGGESRR